MEAAMRSEEEMMHLILQVAKDDERVRAVFCWIRTAGMGMSRQSPMLIIM